MYDLGYCTEIRYATKYAENKRWVKVAIQTLLQRQNTKLLQRQNTTLLQRWIMTSKKLLFSTNINLNCLLGHNVKPSVLVYSTMQNSVFLYTLQCKT